MPHSLRIAIDGRPAQWPRTDTGIITHNILKRIHQAAPDARIFAYFDGDPGACIREYRSVSTAYGGPRQKMLWANTWLRKRLAKDEIDVYVTFLDKEVPFARTRSRVICMVHDLTPLEFPQSAFRNPIHRLYYCKFIQAAMRRADLVLTNSRSTKNEMLFHMDVDADKIQVMPLGVEEPRLFSEQQQAEVLDQYGLARPYVLAVGSTEPRKSNRNVIEAMRTLRAGHPELRLAIAGAPWRGLQFNKTLIGEGVCQLGHVPDANLSALLSAAEMLVFPTLQEGFGFPIVDAMAHGTPVVTSDLGAIPEIAGDAALYVDPSDPADIASQLHAVLSDAQLRSQLRRAGLARAASFRWSATCSTLVRLCRELAEPEVDCREAIAS